MFGPADSLYLAFNTVAGPLSDKRARQAIAYALNRGEFVDIYGMPVAERLYAPVPTDTKGALSEKEIRALGLDYDTDLFRARQMMKGAGMDQGAALKIYLTGREDNRYFYEVLKRRLALIGIDVIMMDDDPGASDPDARSGMPPLEFRWARTPSPDELFAALLGDGKSSPDSGGKIAEEGYHKLDVLLEAARRETSLKKQQEIWKHAQIKLLHDMAVYPICSIRNVAVRRTVVDYGYKLIGGGVIFPPITEKTRIVK